MQKQVETGKVVKIHLMDIDIAGSFNHYLQIAIGNQNHNSMSFLINLQK